MLLIEIKRYGGAYIKLAYWALFALLLCLFTVTAAENITNRGSLFAPFQIGVVDGNNGATIDILIKTFNETPSVSQIVTLERLDKQTAESQLDVGTIPAYIEIPEGFVDSIMTGTNMPFSLHTANSFSLQSTAARLLAYGAVAFLSVSQSGVYAVYDVAFSNGLDGAFIDSHIFFPINLAYGMNIVEYEKFFVPKTLYATGELTVIQHYLLSFAVFFMFLCNLSLLKPVIAFNRQLYARYKLAGFSFASAFGMNTLGFVLGNLVVSVPLFILLGIKALPVMLCVTGAVLLIATIIPNEAAAGFTTLIVATVMLFCSGGVLPLSFLPDIFSKINVLTVNYYALNAAKADVMLSVPLLAGLLCGVAAFCIKGRVAQ